MAEIEKSPSVSSTESTQEYFLLGFEMFNFKSYSGYHTVGPFTEFTSIVGPNGSGKSNLMDAISFALAIKTDKMRATNLASLVSNDPMSPPSSMDGDDTCLAFVKLVFKPKDDASPKISIKRSIVKGASSKYYIDDQPVSRDDYYKYLLTLGFNVVNKIFLIFQNTINALLTKNPKDFTQILEEVSGSHQYKSEYDRLKVSIHLSCFS